MLVSPVVLYAEYPVLNADFTGEGRIDMADYSLLSSAWMTALPWFPMECSLRNRALAVGQGRHGHQSAFDASRPETRLGI